MAGIAITLALYGSQLSDIKEHIGWRHAPTASHYLKVAQVLRPRGPSELLSRNVSSAQALVTSYSDLNSMLFAPVPCFTSISDTTSSDFGIKRFFKSESLVSEGSILSYLATHTDSIHKV